MEYRFELINSRGPVLGVYMDDSHELMGYINEMEDGRWSLDQASGHRLIQHCRNAHEAAQALIENHAYIWGQDSGRV